jgi:glucose/arabinose dehydrogenase
MTRRALIIATALAALAFAPAADAAKPGSGRGGVKLQRVGKFRAPVYVAAAPGLKATFVVEQPGRIVVLRKGKKRTFLDIRGQVLYGGEQGLLSVAFPPNYQQSGLFYVYYVTQGGDLAIEEYRRARDFAADRGSARRLLTIEHRGQPNHNGGQLQFGPDGFLYAGTGDGGGAGDTDDSAQDLGSLLGKLIRIDPTPSAMLPYTVPATNPFVGVAGARPEIYSLGLRNPFRFSFDLVSSPGEPRIIIGDVGQNRFEEIDYETLSAARGANFGWNDFEGFDGFSGAHSPPPARHDRPIHVYPLSGGACALIGGYVVQSRKLRSIFRRYIYGDFCVGQLRTLIPEPGGARGDRRLGTRVEMLSSFGEAAGALYATSLRGPVFRLTRERNGKR